MSTRYSTKVKVFFLALSLALAPVSLASITIEPNGASVTRDDCSPPARHTEANGVSVTQSAVAPLARHTETEPAR